MAWVGLANVYQSGVLEKRWQEARGRLLQEISWKIERVQYRNSMCPGVSLKDMFFNNRCTDVAYDLSSWGHAYLANKFGSNTLIDTFYPNLEKLGWEGEFEMAYGMSSEDFYKEFNKFLKRPLKEQLAILPSYFQAN